MLQYLIEIEMQMIVDSDLEIDELAENVYARCAELAYSEEHLLDLSVIPSPLPPALDSEPLDLGNLPAEQA